MELVVTVASNVTVACAIRRATVDDAALFFAWRAEPSARKYQPMAQRPVGEMGAILDQRARDALDAAFSGKAQWVILADDQPAGWVSLTVVDRAQAIANVGYTVSESFRGHRLAGRALKLVCEIAFDPSRLALERLEASCTVTNIASAKTLEHAGFRREGVARGHLIIDGARVDHFRYGRLVTDSQPR